jgi:hypothetical protein
MIIHHILYYVIVSYVVRSVQICREKDRDPQLWEDVHHIDG